MKKHFCILLLMCLICLLAASCAPKETEQPQGSSPAPQIADDEARPSESVPSINDNADNFEIVKIDVDLSALSSTMVYTEVYNIMINPDKYMGKTIKMCGPYYASYYDETDQFYHYVIIEDATACCAQGLEFIWAGEHVYPDDYPDEQTRIEVIGVFGNYEELGQTYYYLEVDNITILKN